jgi:hypothetical protein
MALLRRGATIRGGFLALPGGVVGVIATGPFVQRALTLTARVGDVPVVGVRVSPEGGSFMGCLSGTPKAGDALFVRYPPEPEVQTSIRYQRPPPRPASSLPLV